MTTYSVYKDFLMNFYSLQLYGNKSNAAVSNQTKWTNFHFAETDIAFFICISRSFVWHRQNKRRIKLC